MTTIELHPSRQSRSRPSRRRILTGAGALGVGCALGGIGLRPARAASRSLKIATYGGNFEDSFVKYIYPEFQKATGIAVESVSEPGGLEFLLQIAESNRAGQAPIDLCSASQDAVLRGTNEKLWRSYDVVRIGNISNLGSHYVHTGPDGVNAVGAMGWYQSLIVNPSSVKPLPTSWSIFWDAGHKDAWGLASGGATTLFEITAAVYFGGNAVLGTEDGILQVVRKIAELKPNVKVWWDSEGTMQTAYENDEVIGGMYFHDVAGVMARSGVSVVSILPKEGGVIDFGSWCQPAASTKSAEAEEFINFMCQPDIHALLTRKLGTAPLMDRKLLGLTDAEFAAVSSENPPINIAVAERLKNQDFMTAQFTKMLTA